MPRALSSRSLPSLSSLHCALPLCRSCRYVQEFLKSLTVKDDVERYLGLFKAFWLAVWMSMDHIQWLQKAGYLKLADLKKIDEVGRSSNCSCGRRSRPCIGMTRVASRSMHMCSLSLCRLL